MYKLEEIDRRVGLFEKGQCVLDLGASPGSWTLYAADRVGPSGRVVGIDIQETDVVLPAHAEIRRVDVSDVDPDALGGPFDVVISDMAPKTTGQRHADQYKSYQLVMRALHLAEQVLRPGGTFVAKIFQGPELDDARAALRLVFDKVRIMRPKATRDASYEIFLVGLGFAPPSA